MSQFPVSSAQTRAFRESLLEWFDIHKRDLPWRRAKDPYAIWVSEIMLQQTRVAAVLDHYANWMRRFPTVQALAEAAEEEVLAAWSGLGYYRRARFLHKGAKAVVDAHGGELPRAAAELRKLPGIGAYTSAAIASIAFGESVAVVDGNVERVLLRQAGAAEAGATAGRTGNRDLSLSAKEIQALASLLLAPSRPGDSNQAMMELGATVCLPRNPLCLQCPVQASCRTRGEHPTARRKAGASAEIHFGLAQHERKGVSEVLLRQRPSDASVMPGMWELPQAEPPADGAAPPKLVVRHAIMQTNYIAAIREIPSSTALAISLNDNKLRWIKVADLASLPLTGLARKIFIRLGLLKRP
jgi:A/G-specific adenine glycosylase